MALLSFMGSSTTVKELVPYLSPSSPAAGVSLSVAAKPQSSASRAWVGGQRVRPRVTHDQLKYLTA
jgi:hypothetical protein